MGLYASVREGAKSQFDVFADGDLVYSKQAEGRWPEEGEVQRLLSAR
jgi:predicted Rdx family selenoprotein